MDYSKAVLVIGIALLIVFLFNLAIFSTFGRRKGKNSDTVSMIQSAYKTARNPWKDEDDALRELSDKVEALQINHGRADDGKG